MQRNAVKMVWSGLMGWGLACGAVAAVGLAPLTATGQQADGPVSAEQIFGAAIHRFYDGYYGELVAELSPVINEDLEDPRIYYLRGLSFLRLGQVAPAADDLRLGAELEAIQFGKRNYNVGRALQRVQGNDRAMIETARADAMKRRAELRAKKAGIPRSAILAEMGRSVMDSPAMPTSRPNLPDPATLSDPTAPFGDGRDSAPRPRAVPVPPAQRNGLPQPTGSGELDDPFGQPTATGEAADPFTERPKQDESTDPLGDGDFAAR